jgi:hypothetical protein
MDKKGEDKIQSKKSRVQSRQGAREREIEARCGQGVRPREGESGEYR